MPDREKKLERVASQTMGGLTCTNDVVQSMPVFRPLIGMDKTEIIEIAEGDRDTKNL